MAAYAAQYVHTIVPFLALELNGWAFIQFCSSQRKMAVMPIATATGAVTHLALIGLFVFVFDWGFTGICWATALLFVAKFLAVQVYILCNRRELKTFEDVTFFSRETFSNLGPMIRVCTMSMFMGIWGWWAFDIFTFMATYLGETSAAAQSILRSLGLLTFMLPVGYSSAIQILGGNSIGAAKPNLAMQYYKVCMFMACIITIFQMSVLWFAQGPLISMYTNQPDIAALMESAWPILIIFTFFDTTQAMGQSVIRATGKQGLGALITGTAYFAVGIPFSYWMAFSKGQDIRGLWWGPTLATAYNTLWYNVIIFRIDWPALIRENKERKAKEIALREELKRQEALEQGDDFEKAGDAPNTIQ